MGRSGQNTISPQRRMRYVSLVLILAGVFLLLLWVGLKVGRTYDFARRGMAHLEALLEWRSRSPREILDRWATLKEHIDAAGRDLAALRSEIAFLDPLLSRLSWLPGYGDEISATPYLTAIAADLNGAASDLAAVFTDLLPIETTCRGLSA